jgi:ribosomal protein L7/L12
MQADRTLPPEVLEALRRGNAIEAIKLLRKATGLGLKEAKDTVEGQLRRGGAAAAPRAESAGLPFAPASASDMPERVRAALERGNKVEAIRLLRQQTGLGLREAKDQVELMAAALAARSTVHDPGTAGLAPGEVPRSSYGGWWAALVALVLLVAWYYLK